MIQPNIKDTKTANIVMLHYITASILFLVICCLVLFSYQSFIGHYFHPKLLAITHITTLGWISMVIIGSLYQLAPVISNSKLFSLKLAQVSYLLILIGTIMLAYCFWQFNVGYLLQATSSLLFIGISLFTFNIFLTTHKADEKNIESDFLVSSVIWFWMTVFLGVLLAFNFRYTFLPKEHIYFLKIHAHIGLVGWFLCLIIGVASRLVPMFLISGKLNKKRLNYAYYLLNVGLLGFIIDSIFFNGINRSFIYVIPIVISLVLFLMYIKEAYQNRLKKNLDIGLKHTFISFILIIIPVSIWVILKTIITDEKIKNQLSIALTFSILFGFISLLILGQTFKNLAFISWLKNYQNYSGNAQAPLPKDIYSESIANIQLYAFLAGFFTALTGIIVSCENLILIGAICLIVAAVLYNINVFKIVFHKRKSLIIK